MTAALLFAWLWLAAPMPPDAEPASDAPAIGRFLIANRQVSGFFGESVIVLVDHGAHGSLGLIVNRPLSLTLDELLPQLEPARGRREPAFLGGPVARDQLLLLIRAKQPPRDSAAVLDGLHVSGSGETLRRLLEAPGEGVEFRAYLGYAGWAPGQLAGELARGDWTLAPGDAAAVFARVESCLWEKLLRRHQEIQVQAPRSPPLLAAPAKSINLSPPWRSAAASSVSPTSGRARSSTR
jgi:putative transcriptional regulator